MWTHFLRDLCGFGAQLSSCKMFENEKIEADCGFLGTVVTIGDNQL